MTKTPRWMTSILAEAAKPQPALPFARGASRSARLATRRAAMPAPRQSLALARG